MGCGVMVRWSVKGLCGTCDQTSDRRNGTVKNMVDIDTSVRGPNLRETNVMITRRTTRPGDHYIKEDPPTVVQETDEQVRQGRRT